MVNITRQGSVKSTLRLYSSKSKDILLEYNFGKSESHPHET